MVLDNNETRKTSLKGRKIELIKRMTDKIRNFNGYVSNLRNSKSPKFSNANADLKSRIRRLNEIVTSVSAPSERVRRYWPQGKRQYEERGFMLWFEYDNEQYYTRNHLSNGQKIG